MSNTVRFVTVAILSIITAGFIFLFVPSYPLHIGKDEDIYLFVIAIFSSLSATLFFLIIGVIHSGAENRRVAEQKLLEAQEQAEENLRHSLTMLKDVLMNFPGGVFLCESEMQIDWVNEAALKMTGVSVHEQAKAMTFGKDLKIFGKKNIPVNLYALDENFELQEALLVNSDEQAYTVLLDKKTFETGTVQYFLFTTFDISERKQLVMELMHARKMETVGQLTAGITHELNAPSQFVGPNLHFMLNSVQDLFQLMEKYDHIIEQLLNDDKAEKSTLKNELDEIRKASNYDYLREELPKATLQTREGIEQITKIVRMIKKSSQPFSNGGVQTVDINTILQVILEITGNEWKNTADIKLDLAPGFCHVECVMGELAKAFQHLIDNSLHSLLRKQKTGHELSKGKLEIITRNTDKYVDIQITDNGMGIPPEIQQKILTSSFTSAKLDQEFMEGLPYVYNFICEKQGGSLKFTTQPNVGTTFYIRLPGPAQTPTETPAPAS